MARPTKYSEDIVVRVRGCARDGLINGEIAKSLGIACSTLAEWAKKYPALAEAMKQGKDVADRKVEDSLFKRAIGYTYIETEIIVDKQSGRSVRIKRTKKQVAPDVTAQIFWLKNRKPGAWRDVNRHELTGQDGGPIEVNAVGARERLISILDSIAEKRATVEADQPAGG